MSKLPKASTTSSSKRLTPSARKQVAAARTRTKQSVPKVAPTTEQLSWQTRFGRRLRGGRTPESKAALIGGRTKKLPTAWSIMQEALRLLNADKKLYIGIAIIYLLLSIALVKGISIGSDTSLLKQTVSSNGGILNGLLAYGLLLSGAGAGTSQVSGVYQLLLTIIVSLVYIWSFRQIITGQTNLRIRDGFYKGIYPLIPVILIILVIGLQLVPMVLGAGLYSLVVSTGIAASVFEQIVWAIGAIIVGSISIYLTTSSLFAAYIVTLPDMMPMQALRSARDLVRYRRWTIIRKLLFLPLVLVLVSLVIILPIVFTLTALAPWLFFVLTIVALPIVHAYMYTLYRELLK